CHHLSLPSFPTRRSSDLGLCRLRCRSTREHSPGRLPDIPALSIDVPVLADLDRVPDPDLREAVGVRPGGCEPRLDHHTPAQVQRSEEHTSELQSLTNLVC